MFREFGLTILPVLLYYFYSMLDTIKILLPWIQISLAVFLMASILLQQRGTGLSGVFGGDGGVYRTRRGIERTIFIATIVLAVLFFAAAIAQVLLAAR